MLYRSLIATVILTIGTSACGGGGSSGTAPANLTPVVSTPSVTTPSNAQRAPASFTITIPLSAATSSSSSRSPQSVSPSTATVYVSLQNSPGHGNPTFSYILQVNATNCTVADGNQTCTFSVQLPIGTDSLSILTASATGVPLDYSTGLNLTVTAAGPNQLSSGEGDLSPIIAKATAQYAFQQIGIDPQSGSAVMAAAISTQAFDAAGDAISLASGINLPVRLPVSSITATQTIGQFTFVTVNVRHDGFINSTSAPENSVTYGVSGLTQYLVEVGNGTTNSFTTTVTLSTPQVQYTQVEFPQLPAAGLTVPAQSTTLSLTCQFPTTPTGSDPCPGAVSVPISIY
jgi:hypothetical protein